MKADSEIKVNEKGKGKRKQAPKYTKLDLMKSPQKKRKSGKEALAKKKVDDPKKSSDVASKRGRYGKSKRGDNVENGKEKTDSAGTSKRSLSRLKGKANADTKSNEDGQKYMDLGMGNVSRGRPIKVDSDSAGRPSRAIRLSSRGKGKANADESDKGGKRKVQKKKTTDVGEEKGVKAKVAKRKMPDRKLRSDSKTKK